MKFKSDFPIILASQSPRRQELLGMLGVDFTIVPSTKDEPDPQQFQTALGYVLACAAQKAQEVAAGKRDSVVIGSDTIVVLDEEILLKPKSKEQAKSYLQKLSGNTHHVITAVTVVQGDSELSFHETVQVTFFDLPEAWIDAYINTEDPYDKAGAYGIQTVSGLFVKEINGDYNAVVGLPVAALTQKLNAAGFISLEGSGVRC
ncbi:Septum formation protein Maf [Planococcus halocryophilus Or1]|uniref:dTTP/UTP pyrophosphatase n=1 Tax=Planococcus halocryophilus TaxID=1215089 RepID=A0A1C7DN42_9BACL|nr:Maf family protein [Planococcus halocryophilus]ANU12814.1 septum formation protein Maf [Planococcus halocryophilus]EMF45302.1 Septum formation protein Maf [Planococcus halocryophilus Or1]